MAQRINRDELSYALCSGPTRHWGAAFSRAQRLIDEGTICVMDNIMLVTDTAWRSAMQELRNLPYGGRHVWKAREQLWRGIAKATNQGESK